MGRKAGQGRKRKADRTERFELSEYRGVWLFAMFDLPVIAPEERKRATKFRNTLLKYGFTMFQFSVYGRYFSTEESTESIRKLIRQAIPPSGAVRLLMVTDKQFGKMESFYGKSEQPIEKPPDQMLLL